MKHKIIVAGCGGMANVWVKDALTRKNTEIVGLVDINLESAKSMSEKHGVNCELFTDISEALSSTNANLVFDVTIPASHFQISSTAMKHGANVFGEKPMSESMEEARKLIAIAEETGRSYSIMQNRRFNAPMRSIHKSIKEGKIGKVGYIGANFFIGPHFGGFRDVMASPLILDMAIHTFDQARYLTGSDPLSVYCLEYNPPGSWYTGNASAVCIFEMSDGSVFTYSGSWCAEGVPTSWDSAWRINGEIGTIIWDGASEPYSEIVSPIDQTGKFIREYEKLVISSDYLGRWGHQGCFDEMFDAIEEGRLAETDCRDNIKSMAMVYGAIDSARTSEKIDLRDYY
ncbi:Gfo/Idh/MocA family protein [Paenibacillus tarimensis]